MINQKKLIFLFLIIFLIIVLYHKKINSVENFDNKTKNITIGFIIPVTSNKRNYDSVEEIDFFKILLKSLLPTLSKEYQYNFYLGYDDTDKYFSHSKIQRQIINNFTKLAPLTTNLKLIKIVGKKGKLGNIWTILAQEAISEVDYLYQCGDDIQFIDTNWTEKFVNILRKNNNLGVTGPLDLNNKSLLTQSFVHQKHLDIFGFYFPPNIKNWYIDDWIHNVYSPKYNFWEKNITVKNSGGPPRYKVEYNKEIYEKELEKGKKKLKQYVNNQGIIEPYTNKLDYVICMFLTGGLNQEAHNSIQTLKKVKMDKHLIVTCLDKKAYDYISELGVKTEFLDLNLKEIGEFGSKDFYKITTQKPKIISNLLKKHNKIVIYTDTDIVFLKNFESEINKFRYDKNDILFQDESREFIKTGDYCSGFMFFKLNTKNINFLDKVHNTMVKNTKSRPEKSKELADQGVFGKMLKKENIQFDTLDLYDFPNGKRYFDNVNTVYKNRIPKIVHNNFIIGLNNKINRFKKYNLWFI